jgi:hypothetical protein
MNAKYFSMFNNNLALCLEHVFGELGSYVTIRAIGHPDPRSRMWDLVPFPASGPRLAEHWTAFAA